MQGENTKPDIPVPEGLQRLMQEFVVSVLRIQPTDILAHAAEYFTKLKEERDRRENGSDDDMDRSVEESNSGGVKFDAAGGGGMPGDDDEEVMEEEEEEILYRRLSVKNRRKSVSAEGYDPDEEDEEVEERIIHPKSDEQRTRLIASCLKILLFSRLEQEQFNHIVDAMFEVKAEPGDKIIEEGDDGDNFYVIESGFYDVYKINENGENKRVASYDNKGSFGELALMYNTPRAATIECSEGGNLWALDRETYIRIIVRANSKKRRQYEQFIGTVHLLQTLEEFERQKIADAMEPKSFEDGEIIIQQGDVNTEFFYLVMEGEVVIRHTDENGIEREIKRDGPGCYFGELALITSKPRAATVVSIGTTKCGVLDVHAFERLLGPCRQLMERNISLYEQQLRQLEHEEQPVTSKVFFREA